DGLARLAGPGPADPAAAPSGPIRFVADDEAGGTEVLVCPGCKARMQVKAGRTIPVQCPRCALPFPVEAGRTAPPPPPPRPEKGTKAGPGAKPKDEPAGEAKPRRRSRAVRLGCLTVVLGALAVVGFVYQDDL